MDCFQSVTNWFGSKANMYERMNTLWSSMEIYENV